MSQQCTRETQLHSREGRRARGPRDELSTHRMSVDEVRAFIRQFEPEPPPQVTSDDEELEPHASTASVEPPTLLYRGRRRASVGAAVPEPKTVLGWGAGAWLETARELTRHPRASPTTHASASVSAGVDVVRRDDLAPARCESASRRLTSASHRVGLWRRRVRWAAGVLALLLLGAPLLMLVRRDDVEDLIGGLPAGVPADGARNEPGAATRDVTLGTEGATQQRMDDVRRATTLMMAGDSAGALEAFRALARAWPEHPTLPRVVRLLEDELRACAARGGTACH